MEKFPIDILKPVYIAVEKARMFVSERKKDSELHCRLRESSETLKEIIKLGSVEDNPFWYSLYNGIIGRYVQLKAEYKIMQLENKKLRKEYNEIIIKYINKDDDKIKEAESEKW